MLWGLGLEFLPLICLALQGPRALGLRIGVFALDLFSSLGSQGFGA